MVARLYSKSIPRLAVPHPLLNLPLGPHAFTANLPPLGERIGILLHPPTAMRSCTGELRFRSVPARSTGLKSASAASHAFQTFAIGPANIAMLAVLLIVPLGSVCKGDISTAEAVVRSQLNDPSSAQFRNEMVVKTLVCGEVNWKNSFGGYGDFPFVIYPKGRQTAAVIDSMGTDLASYCQRAANALP
jgi:hypothetical protein